MTTYVLTHNGAEQSHGSLVECIARLVELAPGELVHKLTEAGWSIDPLGRWLSEVPDPESLAQQLFAVITAPRCSLLERLNRLDAVPPDVRAEVERMLTAWELASITDQARIPVCYDERAADVRSAENHELEGET